MHISVRISHGAVSAFVSVQLSRLLSVLVHEMVEKRLSKGARIGHSSVHLLMLCLEEEWVLLKLE